MQLHHRRSSIYENGRFYGATASSTFIDMRKLAFSVEVGYYFRAARLADDRRVRTAVRLGPGQSGPLMNVRPPPRIDPAAAPDAGIMPGETKPDESYAVPQ